MSAVLSDIERMLDPLPPQSEAAGILDTLQPQSMATSPISQQGWRYGTGAALASYPASASAGYPIATLSMRRETSVPATAKIISWNNDYMNQRNIWPHCVAELIHALRLLFSLPEFTVDHYTDLEEGWEREVLTVNYSEDEQQRDIAEERFYRAVEQSTNLKNALTAVIVSFASRRAD